MPVTVALTTPPPAEPSTCRGFQLRLDAGHLLLHLLRHPLQVGHPHRVLLLVVVAASLTDASTACRAARWSVDLDDVGEVVAEDPARLGDEESVVAGRAGGRDLDVRDDAAHADVAAR